MARAKSRVIVDPDPDAGLRMREESSEQPGEPLDPDLIARRAYERYESRGGQHGWDQDDWLEAERELRQSRREYD